MLDTCKLSQMQYSMLNIVTKIFSVMGIWFYRENLKECETRTIIFWSIIISCFTSFGGVAWALRWNTKIGINDFAFAFVTDIVGGATSMALFILPGLAIFAKVTPVGVEATIFAFLTGVYNLFENFLAPLIGE